MNKTAKILLALVAIIALTIGTIFVINRTNVKENHYMIVATNFPAYDFARAITKNVPNASVKLLIKPGAEMHDYEPTPQDIADIKNSKLLVYNDDEAEPWLERIKDQTNRNQSNSFSMHEVIIPRTLSAPASLDSKSSKSPAYGDEHVWTSPKYAKQIIEKLTDKLISINEANRINYLRNSEEYSYQISTIQSEISDIIKTAQRKKLIFGDRFPILNFVREFDLDYMAAYDSCEEHSETNPQTIAKLIDTVKNESIPVVFRIELSDGKIADEISRATGAKVREFHSVHNVSQKDFDAGKTYVDLMRANVQVLKEALN